MRPRKLSRLQILFGLILLLGIFARVWEFNSAPPGLNPDEASSGVDAYNLLHYGVDRNGESFPVHAIAFGSGQNTPYGYLMIPFIAVGGLSPFTVRLPMLILGLLTLPLVFYVGRKTAGDLFGLLAMLFIAVSPWHVILSRWGLDSNILPFLFLVGFVCLLKSAPGNKWFIIAGLFFGFSLYAYGTAYVVVPIMMVCASVILLVSKRVKPITAIWGWITLVLVGTPIFLFFLINTFKLDTIHLWVMTIPRLPTDPRFEMMGAIFQPHLKRTLFTNSLNTLSMLWFQTDRQIWNGLDPYGYFYRYTLPLAAVGVLGLIPFSKTENKVEKGLLLVWLAAASTIGALEVVNINRINILFIPLIITMALPLLWLKGRFRYLRWVLIALLLVGFAAFTRDYHGARARMDLNDAFYAGLLPAIDSASAVNNVPVCISDKVNMPYIDVLFQEHTPPDEYLQTVKYKDPTASFRFVTSFGRYHFGLKDCPKDPQTVYILRVDEAPPDATIHYQLEIYPGFILYKP